MICYSHFDCQNSYRHFISSSAQRTSIPPPWSRAHADHPRYIGAIWADLVPTVIALAIYFCFADFVLISQCLYYNHINAQKARQQSVASAQSTEAEPLLTRRRSSDAIGLPGSHRRRSSAPSQRRDSLSKILEEDDGPDANPWLRNALSILGVIIVGTAGWAIAWQFGVWIPTPEEGVGDPTSAAEAAIGAKVLGYVSAVCYLG